MSYPPDLLPAARIVSPDAMGSTQTAPVGIEATGSGGLSETIQLLEETLHVSKRDVVTGTVRVSTRTEVVQEIADITLDRTIAEVTRVPIGRLIEEPPGVRTEGDVTIVPVFEERYVVVKQLYLTEELHIRHGVQQVVSHTPVPLRRQTATIERVDREGRIVPDAPDPQS